MEQATITTNILLCVTGLTPQVVTETLFAIYKSNASMPDQVHILTTVEGAERAQLTLINDQWFEQFYRDYQLPKPEFGRQTIHILKNQSGEPLIDIRSEQDNRAMADGITETIRQMTLDEKTKLHVSIAGGRKTMGFYAGYALSLYGRSQDRLSHVLISSDFELHPQFYYPTPYSHIIYGNDPTRKPLDTQKAEVVLADITFVRMRHGLDVHLLQGKSSFSQSVEKAQQILGPAKLELNLQGKLIVAQGQEIKLTPTDMAFYYWIIQQQIKDKPAKYCPSEGAPEVGYAQEYLQYYRQISGEMGATERTHIALQEGMTKSFFEQRKSRINRLIKDALGSHAGPYLISGAGKRPRTHYQIQLENDQINY